MTEKKPARGRELFLGVVIIAFTMAIFVHVFGGNDTSYAPTPDDKPRQDMLETAEFHGIPNKKQDTARKAVDELLNACPNISKYAVHGENLKVYYYPEGWEQTPAHLDVELDLTPESLKSLPQGLRDPQWGGHVEIGLSGGQKPGAIMETPLPMWLCDLPVDEDILSSAKRNWVQTKQFVSLPGIAQNSF